MARGFKITWMVHEDHGRFPVYTEDQKKTALQNGWQMESAVKRSQTMRKRDTENKLLSA